MTTKPPPLDPATRGLLEAERYAVSAPIDAKARALSRLLGTIAEVDVAAARSGERPPARARSLNARASASGAWANGTSAWRAAWVAQPLPLVVAFGLGAAAGVGGWSSWHPRVPVLLSRSTAVSSAPEIASPVSSIPSQSVSEPPSLEVTPAAGSVPRGEVRSDRLAGDSLAEERRLLDLARADLARGEGDEVLATVGRHEALFRNGQLAEEREAIAIKALLLLGLNSEARSRGARFRQRYPRSVMLPAIDAALSAAP
jgi:hypothetical protein